MTNALGKNTCNVPINMDVRERALWGQCAASEGRAFGELAREALLWWAKRNRPATATAVEDVRRRRAETIRTGAALFLLACGLQITWSSLWPDADDHDLYRTRGVTRVWKVRKLIAQEVESV